MNDMKRFYRFFRLLAIGIIALLWACDSNPVPSSGSYEPYGTPDSPSGLTAASKYTASSSSVSLSWSVSDNATGYEVWRIESSYYEGIPDDRDGLAESFVKLDESSVSGSGSTRTFKDPVSGAYVYTVVAYRDLSEDPVGSADTGILYSDPSEPAECAVITDSGSIDVSGAVDADSGAIVLYWSVPELKSVLSPGEMLGSYSYTVAYRLSGSSDSYTEEDAGTDESFSLDSYTAGSSYDFLVTISIYTDNYTKTVTSETCTVRTWED